MLNWVRKVANKLAEPSEFDKAMDQMMIDGLKADPEQFRRQIFNDPMVSREMLLKQRIWVDAQGNRVLFEHMDVQRLINILIYKSTRAYKQYLREYFGQMVGVASDQEYYHNGLRLAGRRVTAHSHVDLTTHAILQELVSRGEALVPTDYPEDYVPDQAWDEHQAMEDSIAHGEGPPF